VDQTTDIFDELQDGILMLTATKTHLTV